MNKVVDMALTGSRKSKTVKATSKKPIADLREWLARVEDIGELVRVRQPVDRDEEMSAITYLVAKQQPSPAVLFERAERFREEPDRRPAAVEYSRAQRQARRAHARGAGRHADRRIDPAHQGQAQAAACRRARCRPAQAPVYQNTVTGKKIDLNQLPIPRHWPLDGGRYAGTADAVITRDPDSGYLNIGTYRMMLQGKSQVGLYLSPGKDARLHITRAWQQGKPIEVAAAWGIDPLFMLVGSQTFPKNVSEYEFAGGIKGEPIPVVRGKTTDLLIPANAELVIEGVIRPNSVKAEGPFGEFPGYYGRPEAGCPLVDVTAVHYRTQPILTNALMADYPSCEQSGFFSVIRSAKIWDDLDKLGIPGIQGVYAHPAAAGGFGMTVISLEQRYAGHAAQVLALAAQVPGGAYYTKWIIAVDEDIDPTDMDQVIWAMASRCNPIDDIDILRNTWSTWLDPTQNPPEKRPYGSKALINACKEHRHLPVFSKRTTLRKRVYDQVAARWTELGLPGQIPTVRAFEAENTASRITKSAGSNPAASRARKSRWTSA